VTDVSEIPDEQPVADTPSSEGPTPDQTPVAAPVDLDAVERDLTAVEVALSRLADGTYWTDEVTGGPIPEDVLVRNPLARRS
jgi:RNA polymerase-binding transcription factor DksA